MKTDTIAAIATGLTPSGIGIIRVSGEDAFNVASSVFRRKNGESIRIFESHRVYHGYVYDDDKLVDEIILLTMKGPKSYTGEDTVELQCHGGILVTKRVLDVVLKNGARISEPGEFTKRAFINGRMDLSEAEAVIDVINSKNDMALNNSIKQLTGSLYEKISSARNIILHETAFIESALDDPEHYSLDGYSERLGEIVEDLIRKLTFLKDSFYDGKTISEGINTVILGRPNVGKSSFFNILAGKESAIVTEVAGTTRDLIKESIYVDGITLNIVDTAGIHETDDCVEQIGVDRALGIAKDADLIIMVVDSSRPFSSEDEEIFSFIKNNNKKAIILLNKSDLDSVVTSEEISMYISSEVISVSAKEEIGIDDFINFVKKEFHSGRLKYNDELFISNIRQRDSLISSIDSLNNVLVSIKNMMPEDFYSIDLNDAYESLGQILGEHVDEDLINEIFGKFCMGK